MVLDHKHFIFFVCLIVIIQHRKTVEIAISINFSQRIHFSSQKQVLTKIRQKSFKVLISTPGDSIYYVSTRFDHFLQQDR